MGFGSEDNTKDVVGFCPIPAGRVDPGVVIKFIGDPVALGPMGIGVTYWEVEPKANHDFEDGPEHILSQSLRRWGGAGITGRCNCRWKIDTFFARIESFAAQVAKNAPD